MNPLQHVIARCWQDETFKQRLLADPAGVLAAEGVEIPEGVTVRVVVESKTERALVIPLPPGRLSDDDMERLAVSAGDCPTDGNGITCQMVHVPN